MLTNNKNIKLVRKDRPWLLFVTALLWICGSCFFHEPWEPYEPFVVAIIKNILNTNSWLIPYISPDFPYLELQPFYFWIFTVPIKLLHLTNIANAVRLINAIIIYLTLYVIGKVGSNLSAYKNGRTTIMILISMVGFISCCYQLSPNIVVLLGFSLFFYALQRIKSNPSLAIINLVAALFFISINFTAQNLYLAVLLLLLLPIVSQEWRNRNYALVTCCSLGIFLSLFIMYAWQLYKVDSMFFHVWSIKYMHFIDLKQNLLQRYYDILKMLLWYLIPGSFLALWTFYRRGRRIFVDYILTISVIMFILLVAITGVSKGTVENGIFPIIIPLVLIASVEVDTIKIHFVSLLNWFSIFIFGFAGIVIGLLYFSLDFKQPHELYNIASQLAPGYVFRFNFWQLALALIITAIWLFMITRIHIRGREAISNWASGTTFVLVMFMSLCIPWFNEVLSFRSITESSMQYINKNEGVCVASHGGNKIQDAIWYYYTDIRLKPELDLEHTGCKQAVVTAETTSQIRQKYTKWHIIWTDKRIIDTKSYYLIERN